MMMNIVFNTETYPKEAANGIVSTAMLLKSFLGEHKQAEIIPEFIKQLNTDLFIPIISFEQKILIGKKLKEYKLNTRLVSSRPGRDFINPEVQLDTYESFLEKVPNTILEVTLGVTSELKVSDIVKAINEQPNTFKKYFYKETECENKKTHSIAVIQYYGTPETITFISTAYFSII